MTNNRRQKYALTTDITLGDPAPSLPEDSRALSYTSGGFIAEKEPLDPEVSVAVHTNFRTIENCIVEC